MLGRLLSPRTLAVIGDSRTCSRVVQQNRLLGFTGEVYAVHPRLAELPGTGLPTLSSLAELPVAPDAAFVAVPAPAVPGVLAELAEGGGGGAVVYSSGFAEAGSGQLQSDLMAAAGDLPFLGPNCYGLINYAEPVAIWPDQHGGRPLAPDQRGVALVSQSSSIAISMTMQRLGLPVAAVVTVGNGARLGAADLARSMVIDPRVSAVGLLVESLADLRGLEALAAASRSAGCPVVALVLGRSEQARRVVLSHSASMASDAATGSALLARLGIGEVDCVDSLLGALSLLHCGGPLPGGTLTSLSSSGGEASLIADQAVGRSVAFIDLAAAPREALSAALGPRVTLDNPLDYHTYVWADRPAMTAAFAAMATAGAELNLLFCDLPRADRCDDADWRIAVDAFTDALAGSGARGALVAAMADNLGGHRVEEWVARGLPILAPPRVALDAAEAAWAIGRAWSEPAPAPVAGPREQGATAVLDEAEAKQFLARYGAPVPPGAAATTPDQAAEIAAQLGFPVVVKGLGAAHKSELGAVRLGLRTTREVADAATELLRNFPGVLVEAMVTGGIAELLVAVDHDPTFGPVLSLGWGGVLTEVHRDLRRLLLPVEGTAIERALRTLRCWPLLAGYRGAPAADLAAIVAACDAIVRTAAHCASVEVNPLIVTPSGAVVADALVSRQEH